MVSIETYSQPHNGCSTIEEYFLQTGMRNQSVWRTDVELLAASSLLEISMFTAKCARFINGKNFPNQIWLEIHRKPIKHFIYKTLGGCYYDVVLDVSNNAISRMPLKKGKNSATQKNATCASCTPMTSQNADFCCKKSQSGSRECTWR